MSARENRGLQAALILFVGVTVVLAVATCVYFNQLQTVFVVDHMSPLVERTS